MDPLTNSARGRLCVCKLKNIQSTDGLTDGLSSRSRVGEYSGWVTVDVGELETVLSVSKSPRGCLGKR